MALIRTGAGAVGGILKNPGDYWINKANTVAASNGTTVSLLANEGMIWNVDGYSTMTCTTTMGVLFSADGETWSPVTLGTSPVDISAYKYMNAIQVGAVTLTIA